jgi:hypothetical protein
MKKNFWVVGLLMLMIFVGYVPTKVLALNQETRDKYKAQCDANPNPHHFWDDANAQCNCEKPYITDAMSPWACMLPANTSSQTTPAPTNSAPTQPVTTEKQKTTPPPNTLPKIDSFTLRADNYSNLGSDGELSLGSGAQALANIKDGTTEAVYLQALKVWEQKVAEAEQKAQFKEGANKDEFAIKFQEEKNLKQQILIAEKKLGFTHTRVLESTKQFKFEHQSKEYQEYWKQPVENNAADDTQNAVAFNAATANINGYMSEIRDLKAKLSNNYPSAWKATYFNVPEKPQREKSVGGIFN